MDMIGWYGVLSVAAIVIAVALRFIVYTLLVKNGRWLPEKATKVANVTSASVAGIAIAAIAANWFMGAH